MGPPGGSPHEARGPPGAPAQGGDRHTPVVEVPNVGALMAVALVGLLRSLYSQPDVLLHIQYLHAVHVHVNMMQTSPSDDHFQAEQSFLDNLAT